MVTAFSMDMPCPQHEDLRMSTLPLPNSLHLLSPIPFQYHDTRRLGADRPRARTRNHRVLAHEWVFELILIRKGNDAPKGYLGEERWSEVPSNRSAYLYRWVHGD